MAKKKTNKSKRKKKQPIEPDSIFFMKIVFYFLLGAMWLRIVNFGPNDVDFAIPIGLLIGIFFARHEHFMIDRRIEYVILFLATILSFYLPVGILL